MNGHAYIGISGWRYAPWRGRFYPKGLAQNRELEYASRQVRSIEINGSFYSLQTPQSYQQWYKQTPERFTFSVKGPRYITHIRRLKSPLAPLGNFFGSGVFYLRHKLGPFLWQLPPLFLFREERLDEFLSALPRTVGEARKLCRHADRIEADFPQALDPKTPLRHALEVRHPSFENPDFIACLRRHDVALVFADTAGKWPYMEDLTSDFVYLRLHGEKTLYSSRYSEASMRWWAKRLKTWMAGGVPRPDLAVSALQPRRDRRDAYVYFDNDRKVDAPFDAIRLEARTSGKPRRLRDP